MDCINRLFFIWLIVSLLACAERVNETKVSEKKPLRFGSVTGLRPEKVAEYKKLHAETWEGVLKQIHASNIRNYSIYLKEVDGRPYLFSYYEYVGDNYEADMQKMAADTTTQRWWRVTDACQIPLPDAAAKNKIWADAEEVFHTN